MPNGLDDLPKFIALGLDYVAHTIKYKHICPEHGIETCHCVNGITSQRHNGIRFRGIHFCLMEQDEYGQVREPSRFAGERYMKDELYSGLKWDGQGKTRVRITVVSKRSKNLKRAS